MSDKTPEKNFEEVLERPIKKIGNSSYVVLPQKHIGKTARVYIYDNKKTEVSKK